MRFQLHDSGQTRDVELAFDEMIIAGMTGRNTAAVQAHIDELAELDIEPPSTIPIYYRASASLLTTAERIQVIGPDSSGEVEAMLLGTPEGMLIAVASDHTDRRVEAYSIAVSKQMCAKPLSRDLWRYVDVADGWDDIELICDRIVDGEHHPYQRGTLGAIRKPEDLIAGYFDGARELPSGVAMFTGTIATLGDIAGADGFSLSLVDPRTGRTLQLDYDVDVLPVIA